ncbi:MAG: hypothetical protein ACRD27_00545 [Terracidiphilus sp.]
MSIRRRFLSRFVPVFCFLALLLGSTAAHAAKNDAFFGYSRTGNNTFYSNVGGLNGWEGAVQIHLHTFLGVEGDVARYGMGSASTVPRTTTVMFGPRITLGAMGFKIFVHGLVGGQHSANSGGPTPISGGSLIYALGGGVDVPIAPFFAWRVAVDRISAPTLSPGDGTPMRFGTGLVFRF